MAWVEVGRSVQWSVELSFQANHRELNKGESDPKG